MLLQSHQNYITVLPALPAAMPEGTIKGICARGGFEISMSWQGGRLSLLQVLSKAGGRLLLRYGDKTYMTETQKGEVLNFDANLSKQS
ncbi:MAG: glycoside hydrolase family 95-like protein [Mangrovibacterium sp.]